MKTKIKNWLMSIDDRTLMVIGSKLDFPILIYRKIIFYLATAVWTLFFLVMQFLRVISGSPKMRFTAKSFKTDYLLTIRTGKE